MKRAKETEVNRPKHAGYKLQIKKKKTNIPQKINSLLEESAHCTILFHVLISNLNENIKLSLLKLDCDRKLLSHFNPAVRNVTVLETKSTGYTALHYRRTFFLKNCSSESSSENMLC